MAARVIARIRDSLGVELPLRAVFEAATVESLAQHIIEDTMSMVDSAGGLDDDLEFLEDDDSDGQERMQGFERLGF